MLRCRKRNDRQARFSRLCAHEVDFGICDAFDTDLLTGQSAFVNHCATDHKGSKIHMQPFVCQMNVFSDVVRYAGR